MALLEHLEKALAEDEEEREDSPEKQFEFEHEESKESSIGPSTRNLNMAHDDSSPFT